VDFDWAPLSSLKQYARNQRTHSAKQIRQIADSIRTFGFIEPVLIDRDGSVIAPLPHRGGGLLGIERVPRFA
jgi:ParB-like chromosome segregation protein Spo0J